MTPHYRHSFLVALTGHFVLIIAAIVVSVLPGCRRPKPVDLSMFENVDILTVDTTKPLSRIKPPSDNVIPPPPSEVRDPVMPVDPVPVRPADPASKPAARDDGPARERTPPHDTVKPVASNASQTAVGLVPVVRSNIRATRIKTGTGRPAAVRPLTPGELDHLGGMTAPIGASNSVPMDERQRCLLLIKRVLYDAWDQPTVPDAGHQAALLEVRFDMSGRVVGAVIAQSSGSEIMDRSVLLAARTVTRVEGLTVGFLREYPKLIVEFKVAE